MYINICACTLYIIRTTIHIYVYIHMFFMFSERQQPYHVRSASDRGKGKGHIAISMNITITEKGTEHFIRIRGFKPSAKRAQNIFHIRFESIKLKRRKRLTRRQQEKLINVERDSNKRPAPGFIGSVLTNRRIRPPVLSRKI